MAYEHITDGSVECPRSAFGGYLPDVDAVGHSEKAGLESLVVQKWYERNRRLV